MTNTNLRVMREPLVIVGAGGHGRETAHVHLLSDPASGFLGFLDDRASGVTPEGWPILGVLDEAATYRKAMFLLAINDPRARRSTAARLECSGVSRWGSVLHPELRLHASVRLDVGCSILGGVQLTTNIRVGAHCILNRGSQIGHDCTLGSFCSVNPGALIAGQVTIGDGCEVGSGSTTRQGTVLGRGATIGMGAVVVKPVEPDSVVVGNPARPIRYNPTW